MRLYTSDHLVVPLPGHHRFPMGKYAAVREALLGGGVFREDDLLAADPDELPLATVTAVHDPAYVHAFLDGTLEVDD